MALAVPSSDRPQVRTVPVRSQCWSCGTSIERRVRRRHQEHRHLRWSCPTCETSWSGPGEEPQREEPQR